MRVVVAMDSFKGTLSAVEACDAVAVGLTEINADLEITTCPMADGGEGTVDILESALGGDWVHHEVAGPLPGSTVQASYLWVADRRSALVEMARASGLTFVAPADRDPRITTTFGTGELLAHATAHGAETLWLTIGGSASVDGGAGAASALGWRFFDADGDGFVPVGGTLGRIAAIEPPATPVQLPCRVLCDVTNPLLGPRGAAPVFGPQKGADDEAVAALEKGLAHLSDLFASELGMHLDSLPGGGAGGGLGAGAVAFFGAELVAGGTLVAEIVGLESLLQTADWVVTGEGRFDSQSLEGKVVSTVAELAAKTGTRVAVLAGASTVSPGQVEDRGIAIVADTGAPATLSEAELRAGAEPRLVAAARALGPRLSDRARPEESAPG